MLEGVRFSSRSSGLVAAAPDRAALLQQLRQGLTAALTAGRPARTFAFGLNAVDSALPQGGLLCNALHEVVPAMEGALESTLAAVFGFVAALVTRLAAVTKRGKDNNAPLVFVMPAYGQRRYGRLSGQGLKSFGLDPASVILAETAHRKDTLWTMTEALRSIAPQAVVGLIDTLDLKTSQKLHLAATDCGLPLFLIRPPRILEASAAATRWRIGTAEAARDRFGLYVRPRWHLRLERCRNGRPGEWVVEYDHVTHCFSLAAALANPSFSRRPGDPSFRQAG
jgi:protein ImuA